MEFCFESINWSPYFGREGVRAVELVQAASEAGFDWISFDEKLLSAEGSQRVPVGDIAKAVADAGLRTLSIHSLGITNDSATDSDLAKPLLAAASELRAPYLACGISSPVDSAVLDNVASLGELAGEYDAVLAIEFLPFLPVSSIGQTRDAIRQCASGRALIVVDTWHFFLGPDGWDDLASLKPEEIAYVQFDDHPKLISTDLLDETTQRRVLPGAGVFDLERFVKSMKAIDFHGPVGLELLSRESREDEPRRVAEDLMATGRAYWQG